VIGPGEVEPLLFDDEELVGHPEDGSRGSPNDVSRPALGSTNSTMVTIVALMGRDLQNPVEFRAAFVDWLGANQAALTPFRARRPGPIEYAFAHDNQLHRLLGGDGWTGYGWPEEAGGRGGSALLRAILYDELIGAGYIIPEAFNVLETIGPMLCTYAPHLARDELTAFASGRRMWSQGFSEPDAGSDMASIRTRA